MIGIARKARNFFLRSFNREVRILRRSGLFDVDWYLTNYPDVRVEGGNAILHYLLHGADEGRDPSKDFSTRFYISTNEDVAKSEFNPLLHYALYGRAEGRLGYPI